MAINVEVEKGGTENSAAIIRRFTKRVQNSGVLPKVRELRFRSRPKSKALQKKNALRKITKKEEYDELVKLGKAPERRGRYGGRR